MTKRRAVPTKGELLQLQKLYKTDEKIGERLGGVPAYLVAYWRRKKNIPKHSLPKFSEVEVRTLWERYGDDEKAGLELGLSKAAFYNWRRRYGIKEKPAFLKLEQLEFNFPGSRLSPYANNLYGKQSMAQKILARAAEREKVELGEIVAVEPDLVIAHGHAAEIIKRFREHNAEYVWNPTRIVLAEDSFITGSLNSTLDKKGVPEFIKRQRIKAVYDFREGLGHQVVLEKGHVMPGQLALATDSLAGAYGALGTYATSTTVEQMADIWATGKAHLRVPETVRISISGRKARAVYARDIVLAILKRLTATGASGKVIEYGGSVVSQLTISERLTLSCLAGEMGAIGAICPYDSTTRRYVTGRGSVAYKPVIPDKNAEYSDIYQISIDQITPQIVCPSGPDAVKAVTEVEDLPVQVIVLGSMVSGRFDDLRVAADVLKGKHVHSDCRLLILPASRSVYLEALKKGLIRVFVEAGAVVVSSGGANELALLANLGSGERCLATTGSELMRAIGKSGAEVYLSSPATAAASALNAAITDPTRFVR